MNMVKNVVEFSGQLSECQLVKTGSANLYELLCFFLGRSFYFSVTGL